MATDIIARGMITEYKSGTNINFAENDDGSVTISASGGVSSEDSVARDTINNHKLDKNNPHNVTAEQIGLGNVDNTSDLDKPISTAVQQAIDNKADKTVATTSADGLMSAEDKTKLDSVGDTYALKSIYGDTTINVGRKANTTVGEFSTAEGYNVTASGNGSHAEGQNTTASEDCSHAEGWNTTASGKWSHAEGNKSTASGICSHAEGFNTTASGQFSHAEGRNTTASGMCSHAGGTGTKALHENEVAYGKYNESKDDTVFSVGDGTADDARHNAFEITTSGGKLHDKDIATTDLIPTELPANGGNADTLSLKGIDNFMHWRNETIVNPDMCEAIGIYQWATPTTNTVDPIAYGTLIVSNALGYKCQIVIGTDTSVFVRHKTYEQEWSAWRNISDGGNANTINGHTVDADVPADLDFSAYALKSKYGDTTIDVGRKSGTTVGYFSTAEGYHTTASGEGSHAEGCVSTASSNYSHAEGYATTASGQTSHAEGWKTSASNIASHASGHFNAEMTTGGATSNTVGTALVVGNGTSYTALSNAFSVMYDGTVKAMSTITASTTADYAEFFEWLDGNPDSEDRVGYFVTMDGDKIRIANADDDYILGVVSGEPFVLGNGDCDTWNGMFLHDEFRRTIYEPAPKLKEILDDDGNPTGEFEEIEGEFEGTRPKLNPEYDYTQKYISRFDRKEWAPVGMLGVLAVRHDGTARVNGYVTVNSDGIATACEKTILMLTESSRAIRSRLWKLFLNNRVNIHLLSLSLRISDCSC